MNIKSLKFLWSKLREEGFSYLCVRSLNQVPVENLFCNIRQHGISNTNPTCFQFTAAFKTVLVNSMSQPTSGKSNCEDDDCTPLDNLREFITDNCEDIASQSEKQIELEVERYLNIEKSNLTFENSREISSVASNLLAIIKEPVNCQTCQDSLFSKEITERDFRSLLDVNLNDQSAQTYTSDSVLLLIENAYNYLWNFLLQMVTSILLRKFLYNFLNKIVQHTDLSAKITLAKDLL